MRDFAKPWPDEFAEALGWLGGGGWSDVAAPDSAFAYVPFTIQQSGATFRPDPTFNIRTRAAISVTKTYYLNTVTGLDANNGTTTSTPKKTWNNIITTGDYDRIIIQDGSMLIRSESSAQPTRSLEVIGEGTVLFTSSRANNLGAWSLTAAQTNTYQSTVAGGEFIARVFDEGHLDAHGKPTPYTSKTSIAQVEAAAGSYFWSAGTLYVHTLDNDSPAAHTDLRYYDSSAAFWAKDNLTFYIENIQFRGGATFRNASAAGTATKVYLKGCTGHSLTVAGISEFIAQNCSFFTASGDAANYDALNSVVTKAIEIDCECFDAGAVSTDQASTSHNACPIARIMGKYHHNAGQNVAEGTATVKAWLLGSELYNSTSGVGYHTPGESYLDSVYIHDNATDLQTTVGGTIHKRNLRSGGNFTAGGGTIAEY